MRDKLRLLLTGTAVSALAIAAAVWINAPATVLREDRTAPPAMDGAGEDGTPTVAGPGEDGVWPSAVTSEDMRQALERRTDMAGAVAPAEPRMPAAGAVPDYDSPRQIGEFMDPDATLATGTSAPPRSIGEFLDPEALTAYQRESGEPVSIGRFLDPDEPLAETGGTARPVSIGRPIDPDGGMQPRPAARPQPIEIGEYMEVDAP